MKAEMSDKMNWY